MKIKSQLFSLLWQKHKTLATILILHLICLVLAIAIAVFALDVSKSPIIFLLCFDLALTIVAFLLFARYLSEITTTLQSTDINPIDPDPGEDSIDEPIARSNEESLSEIILSQELYPDLLLSEQNILIQGTQDLTTKATLMIPDHHSCNLTLKNVRLHGNDKPAILLGDNCSVVLNLIGDNTILFDGIRVPETSELKIIGDGNLTIQVMLPNRVGIGASIHQSYGNITFASSGHIKVISQGKVSVAVGGGKNLTNSLIHAVSGDISIEAIGLNTVGMGSLDGNANIQLDDVNLTIETQGSRAIGIGSLRGSVDILSSGHIKLKSSGRDVVGIGSMDDGDGRIKILDGSVSISYNTHFGSGIGALGGKVDIDILMGDIEIIGKGSNLVGIGNLAGLGDILIKNGTVSVQLYASNAIPIGDIRRNVVIDGGNIQCDFPEDMIPVNSFGTPLIARIIMDSNEFNQTVDTVSYSYEYQASYNPRYPYIKVYLPESISF